MHRASLFFWFDKPCLSDFCVSVPLAWGYLAWSPTCIPCAYLAQNFFFPSTELKKKKKKTPLTALFRQIFRVKFSHLNVQLNNSWRITDSCNYHSLILEHFHYTKKKSHPIYSPASISTPEITNLLSVSKY